MEAAHDRLGTRRRREAARGSPREHEFTADTSYKIDACLSAAAQAKKNRSHTKWGQNPNSPQIRACSAFRARRRCGDARDAWAPPPRASPRTIAALPDRGGAAAVLTRPRAARREPHASARHRLHAARTTPGVQRRSGPVLT